MNDDRTVITCQDDLVMALRRRRSRLRKTCLQVDREAGLPDGYTGHLETPNSRSGRNSLRLNFLAVAWIQALGMELVLSPRDGRSDS